MSNWATYSALATAAGTLVLAIATFGSTRSANRAARAAEHALLDSIRPLLAPSRRQDPPEKINFVDQHWMRVNGGQGAIDLTDDVVYLVIALRNIGRGMAVLHGWTVFMGIESATQPNHRELSEFRMLTRDLYVPAGDLGFWQGALRDPADPLFGMVSDAVRSGEPIAVELLYGDNEGGQRAISRFALLPWHGEDGQIAWMATLGRHWDLDRPDPR